MASCAKALLMSISPVIATRGRPALPARCRLRWILVTANLGSVRSGSRFEPAAAGGRVKSAAQFALWRRRGFSAMFQAYARALPLAPRGPLRCRAPAVRRAPYTLGPERAQARFLGRRQRQDSMNARQRRAIDRAPAGEFLQSLVAVRRPRRRAAPSAPPRRALPRHPPVPRRCAAASASTLRQSARRGTSRRSACGRARRRSCAARWSR